MFQIYQALLQKEYTKEGSEYIRGYITLSESIQEYRSKICPMPDI